MRFVLSMMDSSNDSLSVLPNPPSGSPAVLLTPGRTRNIAQDMEALRLSRQDNPYLQQVMASRESLIENHLEDCESDDTVLMSQEFGSTPLSFVDEDPLTLKEIHEHLIRSPPPISCWPHGIIESGGQFATAHARGGAGCGARALLALGVTARTRHHNMRPTVVAAG